VAVADVIIITAVPCPIHDRTWGKGGSAAAAMLLLPHDAVYDGIIMYRLVHWGYVRILTKKKKKKKTKIK
jgi:hypothetical protein